jgi:hypothetical protein
MRCEAARENACLARSASTRARAWAHLRVCRHCRQWRAGQRRTAALLQSLAPHPVPPRLWRAIKEAVPAGAPEPATREAERAGETAAPAARRAPVRALAVGLALTAAALVWLLARGGGSSLAWAQMRDALRTVEVVHVTGFVTSGQEDGSVPTVVHKDKWLRRDPFAFREYQQAAAPAGGGPGRAVLIVGNAAETYWYFPDRRFVSITKPVLVDFIGELTTAQGWSSLQGAKGRVSGAHRARLAGRAVLVVSLPSEPALFGTGGTIRLFIDPVSHLVVRAEGFAPDASQHPVQLMQLDFEYHREAPAGTFEFVPPDGATVLDKRSAR